jgi:hypothetical protein
LEERGEEKAPTPYQEMGASLVDAPLGLLDRPFDQIELLLSFLRFHGRVLLKV